MGNGDSIFLWLDNWHPVGPLFKRFGEALVQVRGTSMLAKVSSIIIHQGRWRWPRARCPIIRSIIAQTPAVLLLKLQLLFFLMLAIQIQWSGILRRMVFFPLLSRGML